MDRLGLSQGECSEIIFRNMEKDATKRSTAGFSCSTVWCGL